MYTATSIIAKKKMFCSLTFKNIYLCVYLYKRELSKLILKENEDKQTRKVYDSRDLKKNHSTRTSCLVNWW